MNCPKCNLVTFDHLPKCPRCRTSFELKRRLTRVRRDPSRAILIAADPNERPKPDAKDTARRARPIAPPVEPSPDIQEPTIPSAWAPTLQPTLPQAPAAPTPRQAPTAQRPPAPPLIPAVQPPPPLVSTVPPTPTPPQVLEVQRTPVPPQVPAAKPPPPTESSDEQQSADRQRLKDRMVRASQARRRTRPDLVTQVTDPFLPDWYEPATSEDLEPRSALAASTKNRTR